MKRAFFLIIFLHSTENYSAEPSAPWSPTQAEIAAVNAQYKPTEQKTRYRGTSNPPIPDITPASPLAPAKPARQRALTLTHKEPEDNPPYPLVNSLTDSPILNAANRVTNKSRERAQSLTVSTDQAIVAVAERHHAINQRPLTPELPPKTVFDCLLRRTKEQRIARVLKRQITEEAMRREASEKISADVVAVTAANNMRMQKMEEQTKKIREKALKKHDKMAQGKKTIFQRMRLFSA